MYKNCVKQNSAFESIPKSHSNQIWDFSKKETNPEREDLKIKIVPGSMQRPRDFSKPKLDILLKCVFSPKNSNKNKHIGYLIP